MPGYLGRIPSPPDARDYKLEDFLTDPVADAVTALKKTTVGYINSHWTTPPAGTYWKTALDLLAPAPSGDVKWVDPEQVLDQGSFGTCVGNGVAQWGNTLPVDDKFTEGMGQSATTKGPYARALYYEATVLDGNPDDPNASGGGQQGASVRSGMKALQNRGRLSTYASASSTASIRSWVTTKGPVVFGSNWLTGMDNPDANGLVHYTGSVRGGHCYLCLGDLVSTGQGWFLNSWGTGFALNGYFKMSWNDVTSLLNDGGEAWAAAELG